MMDATPPQRILLVDENRKASAMMVRYLAPNYEVLLASSGEEALQQATAFIPDLVIIHLNLPGISAVDTIRRLQQNKSGNILSILLMGPANSLPTDIDTADGTWVDMIPVPIPLPVLRIRVQYILNAKNRMQQQQSLIRKVQARYRHLVEVVKSQNTALANSRASLQRYERKYNNLLYFSSDHGRERPSILIVDDILMNIAMLRRALSNRYELSEAHGGREALERVAHDPPDLILLDVVMPDMDGFEVCRRLKDDQRFRHIPIIFITVRDKDSDQAQAFGLGAFDYIIRPFSVTTVQVRVQSAIRLKREMDHRMHLTRQLEKLNDSLEVRVQERVNQQQKMVQALKESEEKYRNIYENALEGIFQFNANGRLLSANPATAEMFGYATVEELIGSISDVRTQLFAEKHIYEHLLRLLDTSGAVAGFEAQFLRKDGAQCWCVANVRAVRDDQGSIAYLEGTLQDITSRRTADEEKALLEAKLQQAQKMEAVGTLAGGIAHDFNNILSAIIGYTEITRCDLPEDDAVQSNLVKVLEAGERARELVRQILTFSRQSKPESKPVQLKRLVSDAMRLLRASLPATIEIHQHLYTDGVTMADPTQIHQILMNLCTNAKHAMGEQGGMLTIALTEVSLEANSAERPPELTPGEYLQLSIADTGQGIPEDIMSRIFDPFFTTKREEEGTGMGLSVVHGIVQNHAGSIQVESRLGKGTTFHIFLPLLDVTDDRVVHKDGALPQGTERIMVVDDEAMQTDIMKKILTHLGYKVTVCNSAPDAIEQFRQHPQKIDLLVSDITMPAMTGDRLAKEFLAVRSDLPIILVTGFSEYISEEKARAMGVSRMVLKPVVMREFAFTVREVLDQSQT